MARKLLNTKPRESTMSDSEWSQLIKIGETWEATFICDMVANQCWNINDGGRLNPTMTGTNRSDVLRRMKKQTDAGKTIVAAKKNGGRWSIDVIVGKGAKFSDSENLSGEDIG